MTLIKSISGIRGTIGGSVGNNLTPVDTVKFASAYGSWLKEATQKQHPVVVVGPRCPNLGSDDPATGNE